MEENLESTTFIEVEDPMKNIHFTPKQAPVFGGQSMFISCGGDASLFQKSKMYYLIFQGSTLRHLTSAKLINPFTLQAIIPEHDMAEVVMLSVACREDGACITLCENTFTFTLDTTLLLAHSLAMNSVNSSALMQLELMYSSLFVGSEEGCSVLDDRLAMAFKKVHLPNSWSLYDNNDWTLIHLCAKYGMIKFASLLIGKQGASDALVKQDGNGRQPVDIAKENNNIALVELLSRPALREDMEEVEQLHEKPVVKRHKLGTTTMSTVFTNMQRTVEEDAKFLEELQNLAIESKQADSLENEENRSETQKSFHPLAQSLQKLRDINQEIQRLRCLTQNDNQKVEISLDCNRSRSYSCPDSFNNPNKEKDLGSKRCGLSLKTCSEDSSTLENGISKVNSTHLFTRESLNGQEIRSNNEDTGLLSKSKSDLLAPSDCKDSTLGEFVNGVTRGEISVLDEARQDVMLDDKQPVPEGDPSLRSEGIETLKISSVESLQSLEKIQSPTENISKLQDITIKDNEGGGLTNDDAGSAFDQQRSIGFKQIPEPSGGDDKDLKSEESSDLGELSGPYEDLGKEGDNVIEGLGEDNEDSKTEENNVSAELSGANENSKFEGNDGTGGLHETKEDSRTEEDNVFRQLDKANEDLETEENCVPGGLIEASKDLKTDENNVCAQSSEANKDLKQVQNNVSGELIEMSTCDDKLGYAETNVQYIIDKDDENARVTQSTHSNQLVEFEVESKDASTEGNSTRPLLSKDGDSLDESQIEVSISDDENHNEMLTSSDVSLTITKDTEMGNIQEVLHGENELQNIQDRALKKTDVGDIDDSIFGTNNNQKAVEFDQNTTTDQAIKVAANTNDEDSEIEEKDADNCPVNVTEMSAVDLLTNTHHADESASSSLNDSEEVHVKDNIEDNSLESGRILDDTTVKSLINKKDEVLGTGGMKRIDDQGDSVEISVDNSTDLVEDEEVQNTDRDIISSHESDSDNTLNLDDIEILEINENEVLDKPRIEEPDSKCKALFDVNEALPTGEDIGNSEHSPFENIAGDTTFEKFNEHDELYLKHVKGDAGDELNTDDNLTKEKSQVVSDSLGPTYSSQQDFAGRSNLVQELRLLSAVTEETEEELLELDGREGGDFQRYGKSHSLEELKKVREQEQCVHWSAEHVYYPREVAVLRRGIPKKERPLSDNYENIKNIEREYQANRLSKHSDSDDSVSGLDKRKSKSLDAILMDGDSKSPSLTSSQVSFHGSVESLPSMEAIDSGEAPLYRTRSVGANEVSRGASLNDVYLSVKDEVDQPVRLNKKKRSRFSFKRKSKSTTALDRNEPESSGEDRRKTIIGGVNSERFLPVRKASGLETNQRRLHPEEKRGSNRDSGIDSTCDLHLDDITIATIGTSKDSRLQSGSDVSSNFLQPQRDRHRSSSDFSADSRDTEEEVDADTDEGTSSEIAEMVRRSSVTAEEKKKEKKFSLLRSKPKKDKKHGKEKDKETLDAKALKKSQKELKSSFLGKKPSFRQGQKSTNAPTSLSIENKMFARSSSLGKSGSAPKHSSSSLDNLRSSARTIRSSPSVSRKTSHEVDGMVDSENSSSNLNVLSNLSASSHSLDSLSLEDIIDTEPVDDWSEYDSDLAIKNEPETWSNLVERKVQRKLHAKDIKRQDVIYELIFTESNYVRTLKIVSRIYRTGFKRELGLDDQTIEELFPRIDDLLEINGTFCKKMKKRQEESNNNVIEDIGDILVDQFSGANGDFMKEVYGFFCSRHIQAVTLYKELLKTDKKFALFVKKCMMQNPLVRRLSIPECITLATQRLTKYPLLFEAISKATKESKSDYDNLKKALVKVKEVLQAVDDYVRQHEKQQELIDIRKRFDVRGEVQYKNGQAFKNSKLFSKRSILIHEGMLTWKGRVKSVETKAVLLVDKIFFLHEKDQRFNLLALDNKAPVIYIRSLMVREVATDMKALYLVNNEGPEMYELVCPTTKSKVEWKKMLMEAIRNKSDHEEENLSDLEEEARKEEEIRSARLKEIMEQLQITDSKFANLITEKNTLVLEMRELIDKMVSPKDGSTSNLDLKATDVMEGRETLEKAISEAGSLTVMLCDGDIQAQPSAAQQQSSSQGLATVPKRSETFGGFDRSSKLLAPPTQVSRASSLKQENRISVTGKSLGILENDHASREPKDRVRKTSQGLMSVIARNKPMGSTEDLSPGSASHSNQSQFTASTAQKLMAVTQLKEYLTSLMDVTNKQDIELASIRMELQQSRSEVTKLRSERQTVEERLSQLQKEHERQLTRQKESYAKLEREFKRTVEKYNKQIEEHKLQHQIMKDKYTELHRYANSMQNSGKSNKNSLSMSSLRHKHHALQSDEAPASRSDAKRNSNAQEELENQDVIFF